MAAWFLGSIEVSGGFLDGLALQLPQAPGLTCIIGPRGSGKSTLTEVIRYGLGESPGSNKTRAELIQANLGPSLIVIKAAPSKLDTSYVISRRHRQPPTITTPDGRPLANVDMERRTFLPLDAYSSLEIESIADESLGEKRRSLIDDLQEQDLGALLFSLAEHRRRLEANADSIRITQKKVADFTERIEELGDARAKLALLPTSTSSDDASRNLTRSLEQQKKNRREKQALATAITQLASLAKDLSRAEETYSNTALKFQIDTSSDNYSLIEQVQSITTESAKQARAHIDEALQAIDRGVVLLQEKSEELANAHAEHEAAHAALQAKNAEASNAVQQRTEAEQAVTALDELEAEREKAREELSTLRQQRATLKGAYLLERERISSGRDVVAQKLQSEVGERVRLRILRNADDLVYKTMLLEGLRGARVRNHEDILTALLQIRPEELAEIIEQSAIKDLDAHTSLGEERSRKILDAFRVNVNSSALEIVEIQDKVAIELNVGSVAEANFKDASELSRGQKCTALLPLLLARRDTPLVIDQPEDNLDNHFIYETVVNTIKKLKPRRQMIFVTHNANIPVLGEADLVVVMNSDGRRGYISKLGTVDECRSDIVDLLEGGEVAFKLRRQRYER